MKTRTPPDARPMRKCRFLTGLVLSTCGVATMLTVAAGTLQNLGANGRLSLPVVGLCMIVGLMLLGGGFGIMATSAATFDDHEFSRLMEAGNLPGPPQSDKSRDFEAAPTGIDDVHSADNLGSKTEPHAGVVGVSHAGLVCTAHKETASKTNAP